MTNVRIVLGVVNMMVPSAVAFVREYEIQILPEVKFWREITPDVQPEDT